MEPSLPLVRKRGRTLGGPRRVSRLPSPDTSRLHQALSRYAHREPVADPGNARQRVLILEDEEPPLPEARREWLSSSRSKVISAQDGRERSVGSPVYEWASL